MGFEPTPFRNRALIYRLRPLGHFYFLTLLIQIKFFKGLALLSSFISLQFEYNQYILDYHMLITLWAISFINIFSEPSTTFCRPSTDPIHCLNSLISFYILLLLFFSFSRSCSHLLMVVWSEIFYF